MKNPYIRKLDLQAKSRLQASTSLHGDDYTSVPNAEKNSVGQKLNNGGSEAQKVQLASKKK